MHTYFKQKTNKNQNTKYYNIFYLQILVTQNNKADSVHFFKSASVSTALTLLSSKITWKYP